MEEFTHWIVAPSFGIPIVLLNTKPCCPFNREGLCNIYQVRPFLCRSYPVIRIVTYNLRKDKIEVKYGLEKNCSSIKTSETQTIRQWLTEQCGDTYLQESLRWSEFKLHLAGAEYTNDKVFQLLFYATVYASEPSEDEMKAMGISKQSTPEEKSRAKLDFVSRLDWAYATEAVKADGAFAEDRVEPNKQRNADSPTSVKMPYIRFEP